MKLSLATFLFVFLSLLAIHSTASPVDTLQTTSATTSTVTNYDKDDVSNDNFSPLFFVAGIIVTGIGIGIGIIVAVILLLIFFALVSAGIISTSIIRGYTKKSVASGLKTFLVLSSGAMGLFLSAGALLVANKLFGLNLSTTVALLMGSICGLLAGMVVGVVSYYIFNLMFLRFKQKIGWF